MVEAVAAAAAAAAVLFSMQNPAGPPSGDDGSAPLPTRGLPVRRAAPATLGQRSGRLRLGFERRNCLRVARPPQVEDLSKLIDWLRI